MIVEHLIWSLQEEVMYCRTRTMKLRKSRIAKSEFEQTVYDGLATSAICRAREIESLSYFTWQHQTPGEEVMEPGRLRKKLNKCGTTCHVDQPAHDSSVQAGMIMAAWPSKGDNAPPRAPCMSFCVQEKGTVRGAK